tara:strand:+ start:1768 stop:2028 length:261 start_codon:yes stop_codon:yes gene_type:complete
MKVKVTVRRTVIEETELIVDFAALGIEPVSTPSGSDTTWKDNVAEQIEDQGSKPDLDRLLFCQQWDRVEVKNDWPRIDSKTVEVVE